MRLERAASSPQDQWVSRRSQEGKRSHEAPRCVPERAGLFTLSDGGGKLLVRPVEELLVAAKAKFLRKRVEIGCERLTLADAGDLAQRIVGPDCGIAKGSFQATDKAKALVGLKRLSMGRREQIGIGNAGDIWG